jgi:hypothetical protein
VHKVKKHPHKPHPPKKRKTSYTPYVIAGIVLIVIIALIIRLMSSPTADLGDTSEYGTSNVTFYVMSQCPYGVQVENASGLSSL